ncbi:ferrichrome ABC transporter substrate-binding protein [Tardiphaga sp. P9-11]|uniref:ferrichrome ABC transporter substrate-binding protein n=1 Tax=Tardiphaga sp. P9-11 TaxID=2024614 RepID=UPI001FF04BC8|nr:ferrichrome ABC transporter substrate-binding protein [Tardiphaga sp. P9-11]
MADSAGLWSRLRRMPFVVMLTLGLLVSMVHCAGDLAIAGSDTTAVAMTSDSGTSHDLPDQQLPAHSGHCLSHVTAHSPTVIASPADVSPRALVIVGDALPATRDGLPLFKPPRA